MDRGRRAEVRGRRSAIRRQMTEDGEIKIRIEIMIKIKS